MTVKRCQEPFSFFAKRVLTPFALFGTIILIIGRFVRIDKKEIRLSRSGEVLKVLNML
jgi:hypothetical protein